MPNYFFNLECDLWGAAGMILKTWKYVHIFVFPFPLSQSQWNFG